MVGSLSGIIVGINSAIIHIPGTVLLSNKSYWIRGQKATTVEPPRETT